MAENNILEGLFLRDKPAKILLGMKTSKGSAYATLLSKHADCTYAHTIKILNQFNELGIVEFEKKGRIKRVSLTDDGSEIAQNLEAIVKKFIFIENNSKKSRNSKNIADKKKKR